MSWRERVPPSGGDGEAQRGDRGGAIPLGHLERCRAARGSARPRKRREREDPRVVERVRPVHRARVAVDDAATLEQVRLIAGYEYDPVNVKDTRSP